MTNFNIKDTVKHKDHNEYGLGEILSEELGQYFVRWSNLSQNPNWYHKDDLILSKNLEERFTNGEFNSLNKFFLKSSINYLNYINTLTGKFSATLIDPLPHQVVVANKAVSSDPLRLLIADDVGLGKTIEAGLILSILKRRNLLNRILIVCPTNLVLQWQEELFEKFGWDNVKVMNTDILINNAKDWKSYDFIIAPLDTLKRVENREKLIEASQGKMNFFDLIIFDESHHLTKTFKQAPSQRYVLAKEIVSLSQRVIFLTATPHRGDDLIFFHLISLLNPILFTSLSDLYKNSHKLNSVMIRNRKRDVVDSAARKIFKGQEAVALKVPLLEVERRFHQQLMDYVKQGYKIAEKGKKYIAVGFVMTTYRKLASSSFIAILNALEKRMAHLKKSQQAQEQAEQNLEDARFEGEVEEAKANNLMQIDPLFSKEFFDKEMAQLSELVKLGKDCIGIDSKLKLFVSKIEELLLQEPNLRFLIFTEYRSTQRSIVKKLNESFKNQDVVIINGSMNIFQKRDAAAAFNTTVQFLVSTEAGSEGINLHRNCHIIINYDLPWNPMRIVQRIGRLYRYGQDKKVLAFNLVTNDTTDGHLMGILNNKIDSIAHMFSKIENDSMENLKDEILGNLSNEDVTKIFTNALTHTIKQTEEEINAAMKKVRESIEMQKKLFSGLSPFSIKDYLNIETSIGEEFLETIFRLYIQDIKKKRLSKDKSYENEHTFSFITPEEMVLKNTSISERYENVTFNRDLYLRNQDKFEFMGFNHPLFDEMVREVLQEDFEGNLCSIKVNKESINSCSKVILLQYVVTYAKANSIIFNEYLPIFFDVIKEQIVDINYERFMMDFANMEEIIESLTIDFDVKVINQNIREWISKNKIRNYDNLRHQPPRLVGIALLVS